MATLRRSGIPPSGAGQTPAYPVKRRFLGYFIGTAGETRGRFRISLRQNLRQLTME